MKVSKQIEWDMGHRVMNHDSKCKNIHGHRYRAEIIMEGKLVKQAGSSSEGMVVDFGDIKRIATSNIHDVLDHGFMIWDKDKILIDFFSDNIDLKHVIVPFTTTAENISTWIFRQLDPLFVDTFGNGLRLYSIKLWETPKSLVICKRKDVE